MMLDNNYSPLKADAYSLVQRILLIFQHIIIFTLWYNLGTNLQSDAE